MLRIPDRYRVLVVCCLRRGGVAEIGDERLIDSRLLNQE